MKFILGAMIGKCQQITVSRWSPERKLAIQAREKLIASRPAAVTVDKIGCGDRLTLPES